MTTLIRIYATKTRRPAEMLNAKRGVSQHDIRVSRCNPCVCVCVPALSVCGRAGEDACMFAESDGNKSVRLTEGNKQQCVLCEGRIVELCTCRVSGGTTPPQALVAERPLAE